MGEEALEEALQLHFFVLGPLFLDVAELFLATLGASVRGMVERVGVGERFRAGWYCGEVEGFEGWVRDGERRVRGLGCAVDEVERWW